MVFAVDSIPAIFAVTDEPFLVFTSNAFAILGLRALYFLLAGMMDRFVYLKIGLAACWCFVGIKMLLTEMVKIPFALSLIVIAAILVVSMGLSLRQTQREVRDAVAAPVPDEADTMSGRAAGTDARRCGARTERLDALGDTQRQLVRFGGWMTPCPSR